MGLIPAFRTGGKIIKGPSSFGTAGQALLSNGLGGSYFGDVEGGAAADDRVPLIIFIGESNTGGYAKNSDASAGELSPTSAVKIWDNDNNDGFDNLDIGTNNLRGHTGLTGVDDPDLPSSTTIDQSRHSWELQLSNSAEAGDWGVPTVYLVKCGQGGSKVSEWNAGGTYMNTAITRINGAIAALKALGKTPIIYIWMSIGINDDIAGTSMLAYKAGLAEWIPRIRAVTGFAPVIMTDFDGMSRSALTTAVQEAAAAIPFCYSIDTSAAAILGDGNHWSYAGAKTVANLFIDVSLNTVGQANTFSQTQAKYLQEGLPTVEFTDSGSQTIPPDTLTAVEWTDLVGATDQGSGTIKKASGSTHGGRGNFAIDATQPFAVEMELPSQLLGNAVIMYLDDSLAINYDWQSGLEFLTGVYQFTASQNDIYAAVGGYSATDTGDDVTSYPAVLRFVKDGDDVVYRLSNDGGSTFADIYTATGVLAGVTTAYLKILLTHFESNANAQVTGRVYIGDLASATPLPIAEGGTGASTAADARTNLGLGNAATKNVGTTTGTVAAGDDSRLSNSRTPTAHASSHAAAGSDPLTLTAAQISDFSAAALTAAPAETTTTTGTLISGATGKTTPVDADSVGLSDSAASNVLKKLTWANIKATLKTYFDTLYQPLIQALTDIAGITRNKGDLIVGSSSAWADLAVGTDGYVLTADSAQTLGMKWAAASGGGSSSITAVTKSANYTPVAADNGKLIICTAGLTLDPAAATCGAGWFCYVKNACSGATPSDTVLLNPDASDQIDGVSLYRMYQNEVRLIQCDGTKFTTILLCGGNVTFTSSGTFTIPPGASTITVDRKGAGGGGGGGETGSLGNTRRGGCGGGGGARIVSTHAMSTIGQPGDGITVTVGAGGSGGTAGNSGTGGGSTSFGSLETAYGGAGGARGSQGAGSNGGGGGGGTAGAGSTGLGSSTSTGGLPQTTAGVSGIGGQGAGSSTNTAGCAEWGGGAGAGYHTSFGGGPGGSSNFAAGGGGSGGAGEWNNSSSGGSAGGTTGSYSTGGGGTAGTAASAGGSGNTYGKAGGGGGGNGTGTGGSGGDGGVGAGGGGGGGGVTGGRGGDAGRGECSVSYQ